MAAMLVFAFASALLVQTISGQQRINVGEIDVTNIGVTGNGVGLSNKGNGLTGFGSSFYGNTNSGEIDITNIGIAGNGVGLSNNGYGGNYGSGYGSINAGNIDLTNIGAAGNGIGLANGAGYGNLGLANGVGYGNLGLSFSGIGASFGYAAPSFGTAFGNGYGANSYGGAFPVSSASLLAPSGLAVVSENAIDGAINVNGALPFLSAIALEGQVGSGGSAGVQYSCENGNVGIVSENVGTGNAGIGYGAGFGAGYGLRAPLGGVIANHYGSTCGCNY